MCYNILNIIQAGKSMTLQQLRYIVMVAETGTITEAAGKLYISQPSLTNAIHELEKEMNITIFNRTNKGISVSKEGEDFLSYARQILEQAAILEDRYKGGNGGRKQYCVSTQHYSFAVNAFVDLIKQFGQDEYDFSLRETQTYEIIEDVARLRSEIGILFINDFNEAVIRKILKSYELEFHELFTARPHVFISRKHPLAECRKVIISSQKLLVHQPTKIQINALISISRNIPAVISQQKSYPRTEIRISVSSTSQPFIIRGAVQGTNQVTFNLSNT